ncbi:MAG: hypothetical protein ABI716_00735 [Candidatus Saccharibacteria bacterium]
MTQQTSKTPHRKQSVKTNARITRVRSRTASTVNDFKNSLLVVSLLVNAGFLIGWLALQVTTQYDHQVATFLFVR